MVFYTGSDPFVWLSLAAGAAIAALCLLFTAGIGWVRWRRGHEQRHHDAVVAVWKPLLLGALGGELPQELPAVADRDRRAVMWLWNRMAGWVQGPSRDHLRRVAQVLRFSEHSRDLLERGEFRDRLLAALTLGRMRTVEAWDALAQATDHPGSTLSLAAVSALLQIDAARALPVVLPRIVGRTDWPTESVLNMLHETGADAVTAPLAEALRTLPLEQAERLLPFVPAGHPDALHVVLRERLEGATGVAFIAGCLRHLHGPQDLGRIRGYCVHPDWVVRLRAVHALRTLATPDDLDLLARLLEDREWWVAHRAAETLLAIPNLPYAELDRRLAARGSSAAAREHLRHLHELQG